MKTGYDKKEMQMEMEDEEKLILSEDSLSVTKDTGFGSTSQVWRNALLISLSYFFLFTAYLGQEALQSSLFVHEEMGTTVLAIIYVAFAISALGLSSPLIALIGTKWTLVLSLAGYIPFSVAYFHATWGVFVPAATILGLSAGSLWTAKSHYINAIAHDYAKLKEVSKATATTLFFGFFFLFYKSANVAGNLISSLVLSHGIANISDVQRISDVEIASCGKNFCPGNVLNNTNLQGAPRNELYMLAGVYTTSACIGVILALFVHQLPSDNRANTSECCPTNVKYKEEITATFTLLKDPRLLLLLPIATFDGFQQGVFYASFPVALVTCTVGNWWVGYVFIAYGATSALSAAILGKLTTYFGRQIFFCAAFLIHVGLAITILLMEMREDSLHIYFILAGLWGVADAIWCTQITALYGVVFKEDSAAAYGNFSNCEAIGYIISYILQINFCFYIILYSMTALLVVAFLGYCTVEIIEWKKNK